MFNWKKAALAAAASVSILTGCTQSNIVSPQAAAPDLEGDDAINWLEVREDLRDEYLEPYGEFGDVVMDLDVRYDYETGMLTIVLPVTRRTTSDVAVLYGQAVMASVGDIVADQNYDYEPAQRNDEGQLLDFGTFYDVHDVKVQVFVYDQEGNEDNYLVNDVVEAGDLRELQPLKNNSQEAAEEEDTEEASEEEGSETEAASEEAAETESEAEETETEETTQETTANQ